MGGGGGGATWEMPWLSPAPMFDDTAEMPVEPLQPRDPSERHSTPSQSCSSRAFWVEMGQMWGAGGEGVPRSLSSPALHVMDSC